MLKTWSNIKYREPNTLQEITDETLWQNDFIQIDKKTVNYKT